MNTSEIQTFNSPYFNISQRMSIAGRRGYSAVSKQVLNRDKVYPSPYEGGELLLDCIVLAFRKKAAPLLAAIFGTSVFPKDTDS